MAEDVRTDFARGAALHRQGQLDEAIDIYRRLLKRRPGLFEVERLLVFAQLQAGRVKQAHTAARKARQSHRGNPHAHVLYGATLQAEKKFAEALVAFEQACALDPGLMEAHYLAGNMLASLERHAEAAQRFSQVIDLDARAVEAVANRAAALIRLDRREEALADLARLCELQPWDPAHQLARGALLLDLGRPADALAAAAVGLALKKDLPDAHFLKGRALLALGDTAAASAAFHAALAGAPGRPAFRSALDELERASPAPGAGPMEPDVAEAEGAALHVDPPQDAETSLPTGSPEAACASAEGDAADEAGAVALAPEPAATGPTERLPSQDEGAVATPVASAPAQRDPQPEGAETAVAQTDARPVVSPPPGAAPIVAPQSGAPASADGPRDDAARHRLALEALADGRWREGWAGFEARAARPDHPPLPFPRWDGITGATTLIVAGEGDAGEQLLFARLLRVLADRGLPARLLTGADTVPLLSRIDARVPVAADLAGVDVRERGLRWVPLASLPGLVAPDPALWPRPPFLTPDPARIAHWRHVRADAFTLGLAWGGDAALLAALLSTCAPLAQLEGVALVALDAGPQAEAQLDAAPLGGQVARIGPDWGQGDRLVDTAAVIQHVDLVVTGDGPVAHIAGARARPAIVGLAGATHWCWGRDGAASAFYPALELVRAGEGGTTADLAIALREALAARRPAPR